MPTAKQFEAMSVDELIAWKVEKKAAIRELQEEMNSVNEILKAKIEDERNGDLLASIGKEGYVLVPDPTYVKAEGKEGAAN